MPRFHRISIEVEEVAVGIVMRVLHTTPGVARVHYDMDEIGYKQTKAQRNGSTHGLTGRPRKRYEMKGHDLLMQILGKAGRPMVTGALAKAFEAAGRGKSIASAVHRLRQEGLIETTVEGYVLSRKAKDRLRHRVANKGA